MGNWCWTATILSSVTFPFHCGSRDSSPKKSPSTVEEMSAFLNIPLRLEEIYILCLRTEWLTQILEIGLLGDVGTKCLSWDVFKTFTDYWSTYYATVSNECDDCGDTTYLSKTLRVVFLRHDHPISTPSTHSVLGLPRLFLPNCSYYSTLLSPVFWQCPYHRSLLCPPNDLHLICLPHSLIQ